MAIEEIVRVTAQIAPAGQVRRDFGRTLYLYEATPATTLDDAARNTEVRSYASASAVAADYPAGTGAQEVVDAAKTYFQQSPYPKNLLVGAWHDADQDGFILGEESVTTQAALQGLATFKLVVGGEETADIALAAVTTLAGAATAIQTQVAATHSGSTVTVVDGDRLLIRLPAGVDATLPITSTTNTAAAGSLGLTGDGVRVVNGIEDESIADALTRIEAIDDSFYFIAVGDTIRDTADAVAVANWASARRYMAAIDSSEDGVLTANENTSTVADLSALEQNRVFAVWSATADHKALSLAGRFSGVNFASPSALITGKFKALPGTTADTLTATEKAELDRKRVNAHRRYNGFSFVGEGQTFGTWIDTQYGLDWFVDAVETAVFNLLRQSPAKVPQTDRGAAAIQDVIEATCREAVRNGLLAPGQLSPATASEIQAATGNADFNGFLTTGYLVHIGSFADQSAADRAARLAPPVRVWGKGAGAVHFVDVDITFED